VDVHPLHWLYGAHGIHHANKGIFSVMPQILIYAFWLFEIQFAASMRLSLL